MEPISTAWSNDMNTLESLMALAFIVTLVQFILVNITPQKNNRRRS